MNRIRLATLWLGGCSGCHMSLLDTDEWLLDIAPRVELVYGPLVDAKAFPEGVDLALVEGAVTSREQLELIRAVRARSRTLVALGDCAVTGNVSALRNPLGPIGPLLRRVYPADSQPDPAELPELLDRVIPVHQAVTVDIFLPGCPPPAPRIRAALEALLAGEPAPAGSRFG